MSIPSQHPGARRVWDDPRIVVPDEETWSRFTPEEREAEAERIEAVLDEYQEAMSEGVRHVRWEIGIPADLDAHARTMSRAVFLSNELGVLYPCEPVVVPDMLAVLDCDPDDETECQRSEAERQRVEVEHQRDEARDQLSRVQVVLARNILEVGGVRDLALSDDQRARIASESDTDALTLWSERVFTAASGDELLAPR